MKNAKNTAQCLSCGETFLFKGASRDTMGWHTTCPKCRGSFDINIEEYLIPNGTIVKMDNEYGIVDGNDTESSDEFENVNYYICPLEETYREEWGDSYEMLRRSDFFPIYTKGRDIKFAIMYRDSQAKAYDFVAQLSHSFHGEDEVLGFNALKYAIHYDTCREAAIDFSVQPEWVKRKCIIVPFDKTFLDESVLC